MMPVAAWGYNGDKDDKVDTEWAAEKLDEVAAKEYRGLAARLNYMSLDCPDLQFPIKQCSREMASPTNGSLMRLKKVAMYLIDREAKVQLLPIEQPPAEFAGPVAAFQKTLDHEREVSAEIHALYKLAVEEADYPTQVQLQWFVEEQVEEEKTASEILEQMKMVADNPAALFLLDKDLGGREGDAEEE